MTQYLTVKQLSEKYPAFPQGGVRDLIFKAKDNGFSKAIIRIGKKKVIIDEQAFLDWVESNRDNN